MHTVHKFPFEVRDEVALEMPEGAVVLYLGVQNEVPCLWARVDTHRVRKLRTFYLRGTGHPLTGVEGEYIGTFLLDWGRFVGHLFEEAT